jgi:phage tail sheath gpL-like
MVAPCADARAERYGVRGTLTVVVGGNHAFSGGGKPDQAQTVFDKLLAEVKEAEAERFDVRIDGGARRDGDSVTVDLRADGDAGGSCSTRPSSKRSSPSPDATRSSSIGRWRGRTSREPRRRGRSPAPSR